MASLTRVSDQNTKMLINYTQSQCLPGVSQPAKGISTIPGRATTSQPYVKTEVDRGMAEESDAVPTILCSLEKVNFLKKCCASPVLRYILHLLADPRQETLCSWHGGPFGVRIWNTRRFTESYNAAMGTKMNFTNISRALQSCELITIAGIRLWKRMKQGEYSFFPGYTGHGDSSLQRLSPVYDRSSYIPPDQRTKDAVSTSAEMVDQSALDISLVTEFFAPLEAIPSPLPPVEPPSAVVPSSSPISDQYSPFIKDMTHLGEQDIFGNTSSISGEDFSIDETSLLYH
ncbi:unnamed protein product [Nippostrongylus brasiliensis]|uniref:ETS domain-containing protein n=1 Tax=Nippostrongylus brasiliensis TaxID=27835 RepID=A0A0N4YXD7_NIPBR|nr:unnamed protein product [Nippostrongylus brasiliensis]